MQSAVENLRDQWQSSYLLECSWSICIVNNGGMNDTILMCNEIKGGKNRDLKALFKRYVIFHWGWYLRNRSKCRKGRTTSNSRNKHWLTSRDVKLARQSQVHDTVEGWVVWHGYKGIIGRKGHCFIIDTTRFWVDRRNWGQEGKNKAVNQWQKIQH